jgi:uncharacterized protein YbgA (DUF1722 family)/uncharacterized protein YbbK (DUF523 family)
MTLPHTTEETKSIIRIGISSCLLGEPVRYNGAGKRDSYINDILGRFVEFVPVCPEVEIGMPVPREAIRLQAQDGVVRLVGSTSGVDHTQRMQRYSRRKARELAKQELSGYLLKKDSPSCGMERVRVYEGTGRPRKTGAGMFAQHLLETFPELPFEEEGRLHDARLRENFLERVFAYKRIQDLFRARWKLGDLVRFHTAEKLLLLAHDPTSYRDLGRVVARGKQLGRRELEQRYRMSFMSGMHRQATVRRHCNVLQHIQGYFKRNASLEDRRELEDVIESFRRGLIPLIVPITLIRHFVRRYDVEYLRGQTYLEPHPKELMLRNHV